jgi:nitroreductase
MPEQPSQSTDLFRAMRELRAMRRLTPDPVPEALIREVVEYATYAPSGGDTEGWAFVVVTDPATRRAIGRYYHDAVDWYFTRVNLGPLPHQTQDGWERLKKAVCWQGDHLAEVPVLIFPCLSRRAGLEDFGDHLVAASMHASIWPAVQNLLLACRAKGLGAALTTLHLRHETPINALLGIPAGTRTFGMVPVGWPMGRFGPVRRRPVDEVLMWNRWAPPTQG